jgi:acyl-CoA synthetase (NDP forming)/RimJ/RimL family protein N-acetyltransferase
MAMVNPYPAHWEADVVAADGGTVHIRPIIPEDAERLESLHSRLSPRTIHFRFFSPRPRLSARDVERFTVVDHDDRVALVAVLGDEMIAVARYDRMPGTDEAEVAFVVEDRHQGRGLGTVLLEHLAAAARERGVRRFVAETLPDNRRMIGVFRDAGWEVSSRLEDGVVRVTFAIDPTPTALAAQEAREHRSEARSMARLLRPRSVAVIGPSRTPGTIGHTVFRNLLDGGFAGPVYPVHHSASHVGSVAAVAHVGDIPDDVDLAVVVVPAASVLPVVQECAEKRVRGVVVISAGFGELDSDGAAAEQRLVEIARRHGMRVIGPNSMGIVNTAPDVSLHASIAGPSTRRGRVGFLSQSGALGIAVLEWASELGLGVSSFVSVGNKADVSGNDLLQYWESDPDTDVVLLYLESFGNPRKFARIARRVSAVKPIVAVKGGRRRSDRVRTSTLTAAAAGTDVAVEALFRQTGVVRVDTLGQLFDVASVLAGGAVPAGRRIVVMANRGGPGLLAADAVESAGLELATLDPTTRQALSATVPGASDLANPLHLASWATPSEWAAAVRAVLDDDGVDAAVVVYTPPLPSDEEAVVAAVADEAHASGKAVVANLLRARPAGGGPPPLPVFRTPEAAAMALARAADYGEWRAAPEGSVPVLDDVDVGAARLLVDAALTEAPQGVWLGAEDAAQLLGAFGIDAVPARTVVAADEAAAVAADLDGPVSVLAAAVPDRARRPDGAGLPHRDGAEVREAVEALRASAQGPFAAVVQPWTEPDGTVVGVVQDPVFGPLVMLGVAAPGGDGLAQGEFRITPIFDVDAAGLVDTLDRPGVRLAAPGALADRDGLEELLVRVGRLVDEVPEVAEADLHLVRVPATGARLVRARIRLSPWVPRPELALRRMR